jgi:hypothetical protein
MKAACRIESITLRPYSAIGNQVPARLHLPVGNPGQLTVG